LGGVIAPRLPTENGREKTPHRSHRRIKAKKKERNGGKKSINQVDGKSCPYNCWEIMGGRKITVMATLDFGTRAGAFAVNANSGKLAIRKSTGKDAGGSNSVRASETQNR